MQTKKSHDFLFSGIKNRFLWVLHELEKCIKTGTRQRSSRELSGLSFLLQVSCLRCRRAPSCCILHIPICLTQNGTTPLLSQLKQTSGSDASPVPGHSSRTIPAPGNHVASKLSPHKITQMVSAFIKLSFLQAPCIHMFSANFLVASYYWPGPFPRKHMPWEVAQPK